MYGLSESGCRDVLAAAEAESLLETGDRVLVAVLFRDRRRRAPLVLESGPNRLQFVFFFFGPSEVLPSISLVRAFAFSGKERSL